MAANYTINTRSDGTTLTAAIYNADHQNHVDNMIPSVIDDYSGSVAEMQTQTDPGEQSSESQATALSGELERLRYAIAEAKGTTYWYETADSDLSASAPQAQNNILAVQVFS